MNRSIFTLVLLTILSAQATAVSGTAPAPGPGAGERGSIVYAVVTSVTKTAPGHFRLTLDVKATLTGPYDAAANPVLKSDVTLGPFGTLIGDPPTADARVVVVVGRRPPLFGGEYFIPRFEVLDVHIGGAVVIVRGFDDPKVAEIITRLREVRAAKRQDEAKAQKDMKVGKTKGDAKGDRRAY
jgi:hypothetical protein